MPTVIRRLCECIPEVLVELGVDEQIAQAMVRHPSQLSFPPETYKTVGATDKNFGEEVA